MTTPKKDATPAQSGARTDGLHAERAPTPTENAGKPHKAHSRAFYSEARRHAMRSDDAHAFVPDPAEHKAPVDDDLAEELAENFLTSATTGEDVGQEGLDEVIPEEEGGPFITVPPEREFASGTDLSNPLDAEPEAFPTPTAQPRR